MTSLTWRSAPLTLTATLVAVLLLLTSSTSSDSEARFDDSEAGFDDHTVSQIDGVGTFETLAKVEGRQSIVKFSIPNMVDETDVYWMDSNFYSLHDEWYWFRLLNGEPVPNIDVEPAKLTESFETIEQVYTWADGLRDSELPLNLRRAEDRIYSNRYYDEALGTEPRNYGLGSLIRFEGDKGTRWLFELEYGDQVNSTEIDLFFERITSSVGAEIGDELEWVVRSPGQEELAQQIEQSDSEYSDRIVRYSELVPVGEVDTYNDGLAAGRLRIVGDDDTSLSETTDQDILIVESVPDSLPPAAAMISSNPQTPLAHVNLLARNRGIPNASMAGITNNPGIVRAAATGAPAIVEVSNGELRVTLISEDEYRQWAIGRTSEALTVPEIDLATTELVVDLDQVARRVTSEADIEEWRPVIGGKSAGFLTLLGTDQVTTPDQPLAITVKPYFEHLELVEDELQAVLDNGAFNQSSQARFLLLEGPEDYTETFTSKADIEFAESFNEQNPQGTELGDIIAAGGFKAVFRDALLDETTLDILSDELEARYGDYSETQGLRFRSSSTVEDLEGFTGAGLYDSNTGFLEPGRQKDDNDKKKSVEYSLKKTWASYWSFEAYEERERENIDHMSGGMGVLVHARFDDALEENNGVATFTILPAGAGDRAVATINVQQGDVSVANPDLDDAQLPEIIELRQSDDGSVEINRLKNSTLTPNSDVLDDDELLELFRQLDSSSQLWLEQTNLDLGAAQRLQSVTLDFEFKTMKAGWPALGSSQDELPSRLVVKQARSLDPGLRGIPTELSEAAIPRDVLAYARSVERVVCAPTTSNPGEYFVVFTTAGSQPDFGFDTEPLIVPLDGSSSDAVEFADISGCNREVVVADRSEQLTAILQAPDRANLIDSRS